MKRKTVEWMRVLLISPELAVVVLVSVGAQLWPLPAIQLGSLVKFERIDGWVLVLAAAPLSLIGVTYTAASKVLRPDTGRAELLAWPDYWRLRIQVICALVWSAAGALGWIVGGIAVQMGAVLMGTSVAVAGIAAAAVAAASTAVARLSVQDAIDDSPTGET